MGEISNNTGSRRIEDPALAEQVAYAVNRDYDKASWAKNALELVKRLREEHPRGVSHEDEEDFFCRVAQEYMALWCRYYSEQYLEPHEEDPSYLDIPLRLQQRNGRSRVSYAELGELILDLYYQLPRGELSDIKTENDKMLWSVSKKVRLAEAFYMANGEEDWGSFDMFLHAKESYDNNLERRNRLVNEYIRPINNNPIGMIDTVIYYLENYCYGANEDIKSLEAMLKDDNTTIGMLKEKMLKIVGDMEYDECDKRHYEMNESFAPIIAKLEIIDKKDN